MREQRERARSDARARKAGGTDLTVLRPVLDEHGPADWRAWDTLTTDSQVQAVLGSAGPASAAREGDMATVVLDRTPFYAESGGQDSDASHLTSPSVEAEVLDVQWPLPGLVVHQVRVLSGELATGDRVHAAADRPAARSRRPPTRPCAATSRSASAG
ncbi:alanine--tRNA ligase-related protein [Streptomyces ardesiacus]|uniref:alanine--tRNA ligase-related protein n=1 Tax=Streptomyces ardesiacus TaxID=285564 RepID=UPI0036B115F3